MNSNLRQATSAQQAGALDCGRDSLASSPAMPPISERDALRLTATAGISWASRLPTPLPRAAHQGDFAATIRRHQVRVDAQHWVEPGSSSPTVARCCRACDPRAIGLDDGAHARTTQDPAATVRTACCACGLIGRPLAAMQLAPFPKASYRWGRWLYAGDRTQGQLLRVQPDAAARQGSARSQLSADLHPS